MSYTFNVGGHLILEDYASGEIRSFDDIYAKDAPKAKFSYSRDTEYFAPNGERISKEEFTRLREAFIKTIPAFDIFTEAFIRDLMQKTVNANRAKHGLPPLDTPAPGNTAFSLSVKRAKTEAEALRDTWRTFRKDGMRPGFRRAANGKPSNLGEREWLLARTAAFKNVVGDWESLMKRRELDAKKVTHIEPNVIKADGGTSALKAALKWARENLPVQAETEIGTLIADYRNVKHSLGHRYGQEKLDAIVSLKEGIHHAVYLGSLPDSTRTTNGTLDHYFAYPAEYKGKRKLVFLRAIEDVNKNRVYVHEVFDEISLEESANKKSDPFQAGADTQSAAQPSRGIALYKKVLNPLFAVKPEDVKVTLDENNEPLASEVRRVEGELGKPGNTAFSLAEDRARVAREMDAVRRRYAGTEQWMKAPNGQPTKLNERQWLQVRTPSFKAWFGDWENDPEHASKVVDENGEPLVVYHQTNSKAYINRETGQEWDRITPEERQAWRDRGDWDEHWEEQDFYTFDNTTHGRRSIEMPAFFFSPEYDEYHEYGNRTVAAFLNLRNPASNPEIPNAGVTDTAGEDAMNALMKQGYDGFIRDDDGAVYEINAFLPEQIKSATDNVGTFDPENPDIRFSMAVRPERAPAMEAGGDVREAGEGALAWLRRKFVHSQSPVFEAVRRVMGVGGEPPDALNVEAEAKNVHGKIRARQELLQRAYLDPLKAILARPGVDRRRFDDYALALHFAAHLHEYTKGFRG